MTPAEFEEALTWMETRWGTLQKGWQIDVAALFTDFQHFPAVELTGALSALYGQGMQTCPAPSKLMKAMRERVQGSAFDLRLLENEPCKKCRWAILSENPDGSRVAVCARCRDERTFPPNTLWTLSEIEDGVDRAPEQPDTY